MTTPKTKKLIEQKITSFHIWDFTDEKTVDHYLRATFTTLAEHSYKEGVKAERERVVEWAKMHDMPKNMSDDTLAGYNEALTRLVVSHITI